MKARLIEDMVKALIKLLQILAECLVRDLFERQAFLTQYPEIS